MFLTREEIADQTGRKVRKSQRSVLNHLGIEHKVRPDGSLVVLRSHVENVLGGKFSTKNKTPSKEPNWSTLYEYGHQIS
jgi:hypothetical protein